MQKPRFIYFDIVKLAVATGVISIAAVGALGQTGAASGTAKQLTLQAELVKTIEAEHAKVGDEVTLRTVTSVEVAGEKFPAGATITGQITEAEPSRLAVIFHQIAIKKNPAVPIKLSLRAVMMPDSASTGQISPRAEAGRGGSAVNPALQDPRAKAAMLRSPEAAAHDSAVTVFRGPSSVETGNGGVIGLTGVKLTPKQDPNAAAKLETNQKHKLRLEKGLQVIFVVSN